MYFCPKSDDIAVDWISDKLYWIYRTLQTIVVMDFSLRVKALLYTGAGTRPRGIAVDPNTR